ncbi:hypothetical protein EDB86DRAFT_3249203 [Lactarius hatsudake]|nr:hypothetical protein EDB86DRAFT_3249203 [Lactarius hatsudake]
MGVGLVSYATRRRAGWMHAKLQTYSMTLAGPNWRGAGGTKYNAELKDILQNARDDAVPVSEIGERPTENGAIDPSRGNGRKRDRPKLEELTRFTMVKRIW